MGGIASVKESEAQFQSWVVDTAKAHGWRVWHVPTPMRPISGGKFVPDPRGRGLPDLIMLHDDPPRLIFAELKDAEGRLSAEQIEFLRLARELHVSLGRHFAAVGETLARVGIDASVLEFRNPVAAYSWRPHHRAIIKAVLRG